MLHLSRTEKVAFLWFVFGSSDQTDARNEKYKAKGTEDNQRFYIPIDPCWIDEFHACIDKAYNTQQR